ncbi:NUDIX domain-containing protein [Streptomyces sp. NPDC003857]
MAPALLCANGAALCVRRKPGATPTPGQLTVVGGVLKAGEPLDGAARRKAKQEAGARISAEQQCFCGVLHHHEPDDGPDRITAVFVAQSWACEPRNPAPDEQEGCSGYRWRSLHWIAAPTPPPSSTCSPTARPTGL